MLYSSLELVPQLPKAEREEETHLDLVRAQRPVLLLHHPPFDARNHIYESQLRVMSFSGRISRQKVKRGGGGVYCLDAMLPEIVENETSAILGACGFIPSGFALSASVYNSVNNSRTCIFDTSDQFHSHRHGFDVGLPSREWT